MSLQAAWVKAGCPVKHCCCTSFNQPTLEFHITHNNIPCAHWIHVSGLRKFSTVTVVSMHCHYVGVSFSLCQSVVGMTPLSYQCSKHMRAITILRHHWGQCCMHDLALKSWLARSLVLWASLAACKSWEQLAARLWLWLWQVRYKTDVLRPPMHIPATHAYTHSVTMSIGYHSLILLVYNIGLIAHVCHMFTNHRFILLFCEYQCVMRKPYINCVVF